MNEPREYTVEEVKEKFLEHVRGLVEYWDELDHPDQSTVKDKLEGLAFSILTTIDGCSCDLPGFTLVPLGTEEDKEYHIENGNNYYHVNDNVVEMCDIGGDLHSNLY